MLYFTLRVDDGRCRWGIQVTVQQGSFAHCNLVLIEDHIWLTGLARHLQVPATSCISGTAPPITDHSFKGRSHKRHVYLVVQPLDGSLEISSQHLIDREVASLVSLLSLSLLDLEKLVWQNFRVSSDHGLLPRSTRSR